MTWFGDRGKEIGGDIGASIGRKVGEVLGQPLGEVIGWGSVIGAGALTVALALHSCSGQESSQSQGITHPAPTEKHLPEMTPATINEQSIFMGRPLVIASISR